MSIRPREKLEYFPILDGSKSESKWRLSADETKSSWLLSDTMVAAILHTESAVHHPTRSKSYLKKRSKLFLLTMKS